MLKKYFFKDWRCVSYAIVFIYNLIANYFDKLPVLPWEALWITITILLFVIGKETFDGRKVAELLYNGNFLSTPVIMDALQKTDTRIYKTVMKNYQDILKQKFSENQKYMQSIYENFKKGRINSFNLDKEGKEKYRCKVETDLLETILNKEDTWENVYKRFIDNQRYFAILKLILGEPEDEITKKAKAEAQKIKKMRRDGANIKLN